MLKRLSVSIIIMAIVLSPGTFAADDAQKGNIHPKFRLSFSERFRMVSWDNTTSLDDSTGAAAFTRTRTSVMGQWYPSRHFEVGLKFTNEFRHYFVPQSVDFTLNEVFVDQFYVKTNCDRFTLTLGRQDIMLGEGFVVWDGGPLDGSRSAYFNAARLDIKPCPKGIVTLFYLYQPVYDKYLPLINDQDKALVENDEQGFGAYLSRDFGKHNIQTYYLRKNIIDTTTSNVISAINTIGARGSFKRGEHWLGTIEAAYQFGRSGDFDRNAYGGYSRIDYQTNWSAFLPSKLTIGLVFLRGDDPATNDYEAWEPLFGRWPKWSDSYIYTLGMDGGVAYWSNFASLFERVTFELPKGMGFVAEYHHLLGLITGDYSDNKFSHTRGDLFISRFTYTVNDYLSGHVIWEHFNPGDYYWEEADAANWLRFQLMLNVQ